MPRIYRFIALLTVLPLAVSCGTQDTETMEDTPQAEEAMPAPPPAPMPLMAPVTAVGESGITGTIEITASGAASSVKVTLNGSQPEVTHQGHIHSGTCQEPGSVVAPLTPITTDAAGTGEVTSTVSLPLSTVANGEHIVLYHEAGGAPGTPVACAAIPSNAGVTGTTMPPSTSNM